MNKISNGHVCAIILAAGVGRRMCSDKTKQKITILGQTVVFRAVNAFYTCDFIDSIVVVGRACELDFLKEELSPFALKLHAIVAGGLTRADSARIGFDSIPQNAELVAIHDAARCLVTPRVIRSVVEKARVTSAATAASHLYDTVKRIDKSGVIVETVDRERLVRAETPQAFTVSLYKKALASCDAEITDDNMLLEAIGKQVYVVISEDENPKITTPRDLKYAEYLLNERSNNE